MRKRTAALTGGTVVAAAALAAGSWMVLSPAEAETAGACDLAYVELSTERDGGATELDLELTSNTPGETWTIRVEHEGTVVHASQRVTDADAEIDLDLRRPAAEQAFTVIATPDGGTPCTVSVPSS